MEWVWCLLTSGDAKSDKAVETAVNAEKAAETAVNVKFEASHADKPNGSDRGKCSTVAVSLYILVMFYRSHK